YAGIKQLHLIWSGPQVDNPYYQEILAELKKKGVKVDAQVHRFTSKDLIRIISSNELKKASVIIVGSAARILYVRRKLRKLGFAKDRLMDERMTM
ncbi:MAG: iron reductase, partial [Lactobacillus johnsonii]|nr:iron reductase [Lactobacillus johnsonii]